MNSSVPDSAATVVTFALAYTLDSLVNVLCFILSRDLFMPWHSPFVRRGECHGCTSTLMYYYIVKCICLPVCVLSSMYLFRNACLGMYTICRI